MVSQKIPHEQTWRIITALPWAPALDTTRHSSAWHSHNFHCETKLSQPLCHVLTSTGLQADVIQLCKPSLKEFQVNSSMRKILTDCFPTQGEKDFNSNKKDYRLGYPSYLKSDLSSQVLLWVTQGYSAIRTNYQINPFTLTPRNNDARDTSSCSLACQTTLLTSYFI